MYLFFVSFRSFPTNPSRRGPTTWRTLLPNLAGARHCGHRWDKRRREKGKSWSEAGNGDPVGIVWGTKITWICFCWWFFWILPLQPINSSRSKYNQVESKSLLEMADSSALKSSRDTCGVYPNNIPPQVLKSYCKWKKSGYPVEMENLWILDAFSFCYPSDGVYSSRILCEFLGGFWGLTK